MMKGAELKYKSEVLTVKNKTVCLIVLLSLMFCFSKAFAAEYGFSDSKNKSEFYAEPLDFEAVRYLPIRPYSNISGSNLAWDGERNRFSLEAGGIKYMFSIGSPYVFANWIVYKMDGEAFIYNDSTYIPESFINKVYRKTATYN